MKELSFERMEKIQGSISCFFAVPLWLLTRYPLPGVTAARDAFASYCWYT